MWSQPGKMEPILYLFSVPDGVPSASVNHGILHNQTWMEVATVEETHWFPGGYDVHRKCVQNGAHMKEIIPFLLI